MELRPWTISVLSTAYDLKEYRRKIIADLKSDGFSVSAYEEPEFPSESDIHSHDSCLVALDRADMAILIIDKRSGGRYYNIEDSKSYMSITEKECLQAIRSGIPVFTFVKKEAWDEKHAYKEQFKAFVKKKDLKKQPNKKMLKALKKEFDQSYTCIYVDKIATLDFIEQMQGAYQKYQVSNWIDTFLDIDDFVSRAKWKLKGYSRKLIERVAKSQFDALMNKHTSTAFGVSLGDVFDDKYYIDPPFEIESGKLCVGKTLSESVYKSIDADKSVLIYGEAGYGKTTILAKCFAEHLDACVSRRAYDIPLFVSLKNKGSDYHFDVTQLINDELATTDKSSLKHSPYPYLDLSQIRLRFYCDGFDEMAEILTVQDLERIRKSGVFSCPILLTCRHQFANRYLRDADFSDKFGVRVRIDNWDSGIAKKYIDQYCNNEKIRYKDKEKIKYALVHNRDLQELLDSPLLITMFLWYVCHTKRPVATITAVELFDNWIKELASRERTKIASGQEDAEILVKVWAYAAWEIYTSKLKGNSFGLKYSELISSLDKRIPNVQDRVNLSWFGALFDCSDDYIIGTFHEQFMEYLIATILIDACLAKQEPYPDFLKVVMRPEINRYFRMLWENCVDHDKEAIFTALYEQYYQNLGDDTQPAISTRVHAIYHIARLDWPRREEYLDKAFKIETNISALLSLYFGSIKMGRLDREQAFYELLLSESSYDEANRGYHLAYYSDAIVGDNLPFKDDVRNNWESTLKAFERHFSSEDPGHYFLRRIDLITMRQLINARKNVGPLSEDFLKMLGEKIEEPLYKDQEQYQEFNDKVSEEYRLLVEAYQTLNTTNS